MLLVLVADVVSYPAVPLIDCPEGTCSFVVRARAIMSYGYVGMERTQSASLIRGIRPDGY